MTKVTLTFEADPETAELVTKIANGLEGGFEGDRNEVLRRAVRLFDRQRAKDLKESEVPAFRARRCVGRCSRYTAIKDLNAEGLCAACVRAGPLPFADRAVSS